MIKINLESIDTEANYTIREVADLCGVSYSAISAHVRREQIPAKTIFGKMYISGKDLLDYLENKT